MNFVEMTDEQIKAWAGTYIMMARALDAHCKMGESNIAFLGDVASDVLIYQNADFLRLANVLEQDIVVVESDPTNVFGLTHTATFIYSEMTFKTYLHSATELETKVKKVKR